MYLADYKGGLNYSRSQQTAGIFVGTIEIDDLFHMGRSFDEMVAGNFKAASTILFANGMKPPFACDPLVLDLDGDRVQLTPLGSSAPAPKPAREFARTEH